MPRSPDQRSGARRKPPQAETHLERRFLAERKKAGAQLAVELTDGTRTEGVLRRYGEDAIELEGRLHPVRVLKSKIRYIEEP